MSEKSRKILRWKKHPAETGLRSIGAGPRGSTLHDGVKEYATVYALGGGWRGPVRGWFWCCPTDAVGEYRNTWETPNSTEDEAKAEAKAWVKLKLSKHVPPEPA